MHLKNNSYYRLFITLVLGFSSGLPLGLTGGTLQAWMFSEKINLGTIGLFSLVGLPYALKFLWSPFIDLYTPPFFGRRKGWTFMMQLCLVLSLFAMGLYNPRLNPIFIAFLALSVAFFSASQDIAVDAYRTELLHEKELGLGAGLYIMGYRLAMIVSGGLALILADHFSFKTVYHLMALAMCIGLVASALGPNPEVEEKAPKNLVEAFWLPLKEFLSRRGSLEMLLFILIYKIDVAFAMSLTTPFMLKMGFTKTDVGAVLKSVGLFATIGGTLIGGAVMTKIGIKKSLWIFGLIQGVSGFVFYLLAIAGRNYPLMVASITIENICSGLGTAAFTAFMMKICNKSYTATQMALLTSFMALTRILVQTPSGYIAQWTGWPTYFIISIALAIPGLLLLTRYDRWETEHHH